MGRPARHSRSPRGGLPDRERSGPDLTGSAPTGRDAPARGAIRSPNIWQHPGVYEIENLAFDRSGSVEATMRELLGTVGWTGRDVLDIGCGTGFHLARFGGARTVTGVEPHPALARLAARRNRSATVLVGAAQELPIAPASVDVVHARWAYFFGPGCEPGLRELDRVVRRGGTAFVIDNDPRTSTFGGWFREGYPAIDPDRVEAFWQAHGWRQHRIATSWEFDSRADFEAVCRIEFEPATAERVIASHEGTVVDYAVNLWSRGY